jgi:hypothetical protein
VPFQSGSGRLELADAIFRDAGSLAARVIVNRVWAQHFGRGLVTTTSNFGTQGDRPSHPELLDDLSARFIANGWSLKWLHREIMLSATYQQASFRDSAKHSVDPENKWLWRMKPRRLDVEAWRDSMLVATDELDLTTGGEPLDLSNSANRRRTIYGTVKRRELNELLRLHDFPDPVNHSAGREPTTTPLQQLFAINSPLMHHRSSILAARIAQESASIAFADRIVVAYRITLNREPLAHEHELMQAFLADSKSQGQNEDEAWREIAHSLLTSNEFLFVD